MNESVFTITAALAHSVVARLHELGASVVVCPRDGDPVETARARRLLFSSESLNVIELPGYHVVSLDMS